MPRKDLIHEAVKQALVKDGWTITDDPFRIHYMDADVYADLRVERDESETGLRCAFVIEIKSFVGESAVHELEVALGQYVMYRTFLRRIAPEDKLYLAVSELIYNDLFARQSFQLIVQDHQIALLVVNLTREEVISWIN
jgi:hypothetical protein